MDIDDYDEDDKTVVVDNGSSYIKAGLVRDNKPRVRLAFSDGHIVRYHQDKDRDDVREDNLLVDVKSFPIKLGQVSDWDSMETFWYDMFWNGLGVKSYDSSVIITEPMATINKEREETLKIMFEKFAVKRVCMLNQTIGSCNRTLRNEGVFVDMGHDSVSIVSVVDRKPVLGTAITIPFAGRSMTNVVLDALSESHYELLKSKSLKEKWDLAGEAKEKGCYVADEYDKVLAELKPESNIIRLSTGEEIKLGEEVIKGPEMLFRPSLSSSSYPSIQTAVLNSRNQCPALVEMGDNGTKVVLTGGSSLLKGFNARLQKELNRIDKRCTVMTAADPMYTAWKGATEYVKRYKDDQLTNSIWISREEFEEDGVRVVYRKLR